ncbi:MAG: HAD-IC family P-type ATPase, partial [Ferrovibrio sp.]
PALTGMVAATGFSEGEILRLAASVEAASEHPLALAIVSAAKERKIELAPVQDFDSPTGKGAVGTVDGKRVAIGQATFLAELSVATESLQPDADRLRGDGATVVFVAVGGRLAGLLAIADPIKTETRAALEALRAENIRVVMLTGDNRTTALAVAKRLGIADVEAEVLPDGKAAVVEKLRAEGRVV